MPEFGEENRVQIRDQDVVFYRGNTYGFRFVLSTDEGGKYDFVDAGETVHLVAKTNERHETKVWDIEGVAVDGSKGVVVFTIDDDDLSIAYPHLVIEVYLEGADGTILTIDQFTATVLESLA